MDIIPVSICLALLIVANGAPVLATDIFKSRWARPVDGGHTFVDGKPWFGNSKTWRGLLAAVVATALAGQLLGIGWHWGAAVGALAMSGDLLSSFAKRRIGITVSGRAWLLDQLPESVLPVLLLREPLGLESATDAVSVIVVFVLLEVTMSPLLYRLHIRRRPY